MSQDKKREGGIQDKGKRMEKRPGGVKNVGSVCVLKKGTSALCCFGM